MKNWLLFVFGPLLAIDTCVRVGHEAWRVSTAVSRWASDTRLMVSADKDSANHDKDERITVEQNFGLHKVDLGARVKREGALCL